MLCVLYRQQISNPDAPGLTLLDLELLTACTREELASGLWYLCEKKWVTIGEFTQYCISADGFDVVESQLEDRLEFRALATWCNYGFHANGEDPVQVEPRLWIEDRLPSDISGEDHYHTLSIGPDADEETIERVYRTLSGRFHPDDHGTDDAKTFQRIREAYETLSDPARRAGYDALRQRTKGSARFRLQGREFFDGIKGEQNRRLAVLCLLYRQALSESPGLTVLDLEQLTGCTREELTSALWYLREKKWAKSGEYTEYSITAAGFDVVETAAQPGPQSRQRATVGPQFPVENRNSRLIAEGGQADIKTEEPENMKVEQGALSVTIEQTPGVPEGGTARFWNFIVPEDTALVAAAQDTPQSPGVSLMSNPTNAVTEQAGGAAVRAVKRVIFSMGGKGGVGKTNVMTGLAEWFEENQIPVTLLDLDTENKAKGSLTHFFGGRVPKINIHTPAGLDAFVDILAEEAPAILADMGAGSGQITHDWFDKMHPDAASAGIVFTAIGVVTSDPASVESVLNWAAALQNRVDYIVVENSLTEHADFTYWRTNDEAEAFRRRFRPSIIGLDCRLADLENASRNYGVTLGRVAGRTATQPELQKASLVMRAQSYRRRMFAGFDSVKELLLP